MVDKFNFPDGTKRMIRKHALDDLLAPGATPLRHRPPRAAWSCAAWPPVCHSHRGLLRRVGVILPAGTLGQSRLESRLDTLQLSLC